MFVPQLESVAKVHQQSPTLVFATLALQRRFRRRCLRAVPQKLWILALTLPFQYKNGPVVLTSFWISVFLPPPPQLHLIPVISCYTPGGNTLLHSTIRLVFSDRLFRPKCKTLPELTLLHETRENLLVFNPLPATEICAGESDNYCLMDSAPGRKKPEILF